MTRWKRNHNGNSPIEFIREESKDIYYEPRKPVIPMKDLADFEMGICRWKGKRVNFLTKAEAEIFGAECAKMKLRYPDKYGLIEISEPGFEKPYAYKDGRWYIHLRKKGKNK